MIYQKLYNWQQNIINKFKSYESFGLFLDCGLGKTPVSLGFTEVNKCDKVLIITLNPKALETVETPGSWLQWASYSEIKYEFKNKFSEEFNSEIPELLITNYEALYERNSSKKEKVTLKKYIKDFINSSKFHNVGIIIDESHKVKNLKSLQTFSIIKIKKELSKYSRVYTYLLTGTPFTTGYVDLYAQLKILGCPMLKGEFKERFCKLGNVKGLLGWQQPIIGYKNVDELFNLLHQYAITIKSDDVVNLPDKIVVNHSLEMSDVFKAFTKEKEYTSEINKLCSKLKINKIKESDSKVINPFYRNINYPDLKWFAETSGQFWLRARQLSIGFQGNADEFRWFDKNRLKLLEKFLQEHEDNYLLFYNYTPELLEIYEICEKLGYNIDVYCGEAKSMVFYEKYCRLSEGEKLVNKKNIILANFASGSTGMNWQQYNKCIIFSCPLYKDYEQGIKRIHRIGQKSTTIYHIFYQKNWLDYSMRKALEDKIEYSLDMFNSDLERINSLDLE